MYLTQEQIDVLTQNLRKKRLRIELLDFDMKTVDTIEGYAIGGSITADADNDIRRSGSVQMVIPNVSRGTTLLDQLDGFSIEVGGKIWLDRYVKIFVGIDDILSKEQKTIWFKLGVFLINKPIREMSADNYTLSFECIDLMSKLTGLRQGQLTSLSTMIPSGEYKTDENGKKYFERTEIASVLIPTITELGGFHNYSIYPIPESKKYLAYDIKLGVGATVYDILKELMSMLYTWQMYFDLDGVFVVEPIPSGENDVVYDLDSQQYISNTLSVDFENVKNQVIVYGRTNSLTYYTENTADNPNNVVYRRNAGGGTLTLVLNYSAINQDSLVKLATTFGFMSLSDSNSLPITNVEIQVNGLPVIYTHDNIDVKLVRFENSTNSFGLNYDTTQVETLGLPVNEVCFLRIYDAELNDNEFVDSTKSITFEFTGKQVVSYTLVNHNKKSPFYVNNNLKENNFYCEKPLNNLGSKYELALSWFDSSEQIVTGLQLTFMPTVTNTYAEGQNCTFVDALDPITITPILSNIPIVQDVWVKNSEGNVTRPYLQEGKIEGNYTIYLLEYEKFNGNEWFVFKGRSPSVISKVFSGGEYDNIYADQLAYERCLLELYKASNLNDNISLSVVPNYSLDVNCKIAYNPNNFLPKNIYDSQPYNTKTGESSNKYAQFVTAYNKDFYVKYDAMEYALTKQVTYPLGIDSTPQDITAVRIYESGNLMGSDYKK